jgi:glycosyltransferase involved in cell wall biosynthesis
VRVLIDLRVLSQGLQSGLARYATAMAGALAGRPDVECLLAGSDCRTLGRWPAATVIPIDLPVGDHDRASWWLDGLAVLYDADLIFSPYDPLPRHRSSPRVISIHDLIPLKHPEWLADERAFRFFDEEIRAGALAANRVIVDTAAVARDVERLLGVAPHKITVVPLAPAAAFARPDRAGLGASRREADAYVLSVATVEPRKNLRRLVQAMDIVRGRLGARSPRLLLAGKLGWNVIESLPDESVQSRGSCEILGFVEDAELAALYEGALALVMPSLDEGFGLPILEAMACGCPVACSDIPPFREVGGDAATFFDPMMPEAIADSIVGLVEHGDLRARMARRGRAHAGLFSWQRTADATLEVFRETLREPR